MPVDLIDTAKTIASKALDIKSLKKAKTTSIAAASAFFVSQVTESKKTIKGLN